MQALKFIVIGMGILIVLAVGLIGYGLYKKSVDPGWKLFGPQPDAPTTSAPAAAPNAFGNIDLGLEGGCHVIGVQPDGRRAYLLIGPIGRCDGVIVVDTGDGRVLGRFNP